MTQQGKVYIAQKEKIKVCKRCGSAVEATYTYGWEGGGFIVLFCLFVLTAGICLVLYIVALIFNRDSFLDAYHCRQCGASFSNQEVLTARIYDYYP